MHSTITSKATRAAEKALRAASPPLLALLAFESGQTARALSLMINNIAQELSGFHNASAKHRVFWAKLTGLECTVLEQKSQTKRNCKRFRNAEFCQKTQEGCGCFWGLCKSSGEKFRENSGKIAGNFSQITKRLKIWDFGHRERQPCRKHWATLCRPSVRDVLRNRQLQPSQAFLILGH